MSALITRSLSETAPLFSEVRPLFALVHRAVHILSNKEDRSVFELRRDYRHLLSEMLTHRVEEGLTGEAVHLFVKVTKSYWRGLFHAYAVPDLPRTNNDLEQFFGTARHAERRITGHKQGSPTLVLRGPVRLVALAMAREDVPQAADLQPHDPDAWWASRRALEARQHTRRQMLRYRKDPDAYLRALEDSALQPTLPP